jgi:hypothetical protein
MPPPWLTGLYADLVELAQDPAIREYCSSAYFAWRNEVRLRLGELLRANPEWRDSVLREFDGFSFPGVPQEWPTRLMVIGNYLTGLLFTIGRLGQDLEFNDAWVHKPHLGFHVPIVGDGSVEVAAQPQAGPGADAEQSGERQRAGRQ